MCIELYRLGVGAPWYVLGGLVNCVGLLNSGKFGGARGDTVPFIDLGDLPGVCMGESMGEATNAAGKCMLIATIRPVESSICTGSAS